MDDACQKLLVSAGKLMMKVLFNIEWTRSQCGNQAGNSRFPSCEVQFNEMFESCSMSMRSWQYLWVPTI